LLTGVPYSEPSIHGREAGGSPYGATLFNEDGKPHTNERKTATALGKRIAQIALACRQTQFEDSHS